jgi:hypothetical protein
MTTKLWMYVLVVQIGLLACGKGDDADERSEAGGTNSPRAERGEQGVTPDDFGTADPGRILTPEDLPYEHELYDIRDVRAIYSGNTVRVELQFVSHLDIESRFSMPFRRSFMVDDGGRRHEAARASDSYLQFQPEVPEWIWVEFGEVDTPPGEVNIALPIRATRDHVGEEWFHLGGVEIASEESR